MDSAALLLAHALGPLDGAPELVELTERAADGAPEAFSAGLARAWRRLGPWMFLSHVALPLLQRLPRAAPAAPAEEGPCGGGRGLALLSAFLATRAGELARGAAGPRVAVVAPPGGTTAVSAAVAFVELALADVRVELAERPPARAPEGAAGAVVVAGADTAPRRLERAASDLRRAGFAAVAAFGPGATALDAGATARADCTRLATLGELVQWATRLDSRA